MLVGATKWYASSAFRRPNAEGRADFCTRAHDRNITITTRLVDTVTIPMLLKSVLSGRLAPRKLITHEFRLEEMMKAYDTFGDTTRQKALKIMLRAPTPCMARDVLLCRVSTSPTAKKDAPPWLR